MKNRFIYFSIVILILLYSYNAAFASYLEDFNQIQMVSENCMSQTGGNTQVANECSIKEQHAWEKEIDKLIVDFKKILTSDDYKLFLKSQKKWENYKKESFKIFSKIPSYKSATMFQNIQQGCKTGIVKQRALNLYEYLQYFKEDN